MCELFAMSSATPVAIRYSLHEFAKHGGRTHENKSGWGISFQQDHDSLLFKEPEPADNSPWVSFIASQAVETNCVIAHVRRASHGAPRFENTHPFRQEMAGRAQVFAHNGTLNGFNEALPLKTGQFQPIGETDSEHAFCYLLEQLQPLWKSGEPSIADRLETVVEAAKHLRDLGSANFLYNDGDVLFVHADQRMYDEGGILSPPKPPGLHWINRQAYLTKGLSVSRTTAEQTPAIMIASVPLSLDSWQGIPRGSVFALRDGKLVGKTHLAENGTGSRS